MRVTVKIRMPDDTSERSFHLSPDKAERFAAKIIRNGGTARIVPFQMGADLIAMLTKAGVNVANVK